MTTLLTLTRAARLAGVKRAELQRRVRQGELATFEGQVAANDLLRLYPRTSLDDDSELDRVERIKAEAVPRRGDVDTALPSAEILLARLRSISAVLTRKLAAMDALEGVLDELNNRLATLARDHPSSATTPRIQDTLSWLDQARTELAAGDKLEDQTNLLARDALLRIMAASVKIIPSGHEFFVEGSESILEAAVRAGLSLNYGCSSGNCGACKARVVSGEVRGVREHDHVLGEREKRIGYCLTCSTTAVTDVVLEAAEALSAADLPEQEIRASVRKVEPLSQDICLLRIQTPRTQTLRFMAGQRVELTLEDGSRAERHIASCPCNGRNLEFFIERDPESAFASAVHAGLRHGQLAQVKGPTGSFVLDEESSDPAVFIAFGQGIAPVKSLIEHAVSIDIIESFHLYWLAARPEDHHQPHWCRALKDALDNFYITPLVSTRPDEVLLMLDADLPDLTAPRYYIVGDAPQVAAIEDHLRARGVAAQRIRSDILP